MDFVKKRHNCVLKIHRDGYVLVSFFFFFENLTQSLWGII